MKYLNSWKCNFFFAWFSHQEFCLMCTQLFHDAFLIPYQPWIENYTLHVFLLYSKWHSWYSCKIHCSVGLMKRGTENGIKRSEMKQRFEGKQINKFCWHSCLQSNTVTNTQYALGVFFFYETPVCVIQTQ